MLDPRKTHGQTERQPDGWTERLTHTPEGAISSSMSSCLMADLLVLFVLEHAIIVTTCHSI